MAGTKRLAAFDLINGSAPSCTVSGKAGDDSAECSCLTEDFLLQELMPVENGRGLLLAGSGGDWVKMSPGVLAGDS